MTCDLCHQDTRNRKRVKGYLMCTACRESDAYWDSLTPEQKRYELELMARYGTEEPA